jgi:NDP-sugar pyrophosphorylase family protein
LKENPNFEKFTEVLVADDRVTGFGQGFPEKSKNRDDNSGSPLMFTGIHILEPRVFDYIPRGVYSDIVPTFYNPAILKGETISAHITFGKWFELSTIPRYLEISLRMLNGLSEKVVVGKNSVISSTAKVEDSVIWDDVLVGENAEISHSIIGDGVRIKNHEVYKNVAIVKAEMVRAHPEIPQKALKGKFVGDNYVVSLDQ